MEYFKSVISYFFKNFGFVMLFSVIPAVFFGSLLSPFKMVEFLYLYPTLTLDTFGEFFCAMVPLDWLTILLTVVGLILMAFFVSILFGKLESHFRIGKRSWGIKNTGANNNFPGVLFNILIFIVCYLVLALLGTLLITLLNFIFSVGAVAGVAEIILVYAVAALLISIMSYLTLLFALVALDMMIMGSPFNVAISNASHAIHKNTWKSFFAALIPFIVAAGLTILGSWLGIVWLTNIIGMAILVPYICILAMTIFFKNYDLQRYDTRPYYNLK